MSYNKILDNDVKEIKELLIKLVEETKKQFTKTYNLFLKSDKDVLLKISQNNKIIIEMQNDFTKVVLWKIVKQKLVARDLRIAVGGILISREVKRIASICKQMSKFVEKNNVIELISKNKKNDKIFLDIFEYVEKIFEFSNTILNLIISLLENFDEDQYRNAFVTEVDMFKKIMGYTHVISDLITDGKTIETRMNALVILKMIKITENVMNGLFSIEEIIHFVCTGSFDDFEIYSLIVNNNNNKEN